MFVKIELLDLPFSQHTFHLKKNFKTCLSSGMYLGLPSLKSFGKEALCRGGKQSFSGFFEVVRWRSNLETLGHRESRWMKGCCRWHHWSGFVRKIKMTSLGPVGRMWIQLWDQLRQVDPPVRQVRLQCLFHHSG